MTLTEKLCSLQNEFIIGKKKRNEFGDFNYRNIEDMLTVLKPLLNKYKVVLTFNESIHVAGERIYIVSEAMLNDTESSQTFMSRAYAREPLQKKGMDDSQITGSATSYARKSALAGLFAVDNGERDADSQDNSGYIDQPMVGTNGLTALKMLDDLELAKPGYTQKLCAAKGVEDSSKLEIGYIEKAWNTFIKPKLEATNATV